LKPTRKSKDLMIVELLALAVFALIAACAVIARG